MTLPERLEKKRRSSEIRMEPEAFAGKLLDLRDFHGLLDRLDVRHLHLLLDGHLDNLILILDLRHLHLPETGQAFATTQKRFFPNGSLDLHRT